MALPENVDQEKLADAALAILSLTAWGEDFGARAYKGIDWGLLDVFYQKGWIGDPVGKQESVHITDQGVALAAEFLEKHLGVSRHWPWPRCPLPTLGPCTIKLFGRNACAQGSGARYCAATPVT